MCDDCIDVYACFVYIRTMKYGKCRTCRTCSCVNVLCYHIVIRMYSKQKRNAISLIEFGMDSGTDNSSAVREIIVTVLSKPILFGRGMPFTDQSSVY